MGTFTDSIVQALRLLWAGDPDLFGIIALSLQVSGAALAISAILGVPAGAAVGLTHRRGKRLVTAILYTGMGLPPVVVGLLVYLLLSRSGPLGALDWLFTPAAMIAAQVVIAFPLVAGLTMTAVQSVNPDFRLQMRSLGATRVQEAWAVIQEARPGVVAAILAAFGAIISEVGAVMLVGGNIAGRTRVLTTAIVLDTRQGDFARAMALGMILLGLAFAANLALLRLQGRTGGHS